MGFPRQAYWSGLPFLSPGDLPLPRIEPGSSELQADSLPSEPSGKPYSSRSLEFIYLVNKSLCPLVNLSPLTSFPKPLKTTILLSVPMSLF